jgi:hypothetical protein
VVGESKGDSAPAPRRAELSDERLVFSAEEIDATLQGESGKSITR